MFNLIFNVESEFNCLNFKPGALSVRQSLILQIKIFINLSAVLFLSSIPITSICIIVSYLNQH